MKYSHLDETALFVRSAMPSLNSLATEAQAERKPSHSDGIPADLEEELCVFGCQQIQQAGILLRLPQVAMGTAQVLFQRFWYVSSMRQFNVIDIAMGALLLASKLEEAPLRLREILLVFDYLGQRARHFAKYTPGQRTVEAYGRPSSKQECPPFSYKPSGYYTDAYYDAKDALVVAEMQILKRLGFDVQVNLPHALMINYMQVLGVANKEIAMEEGPPMTAAQLAWNYLSDAYVFILTQPAISRVLSIPTPCDCLRVHLPVDATVFHLSSARAPDPSSGTGAMVDALRCDTRRAARGGKSHFAAL